MSSENFDHLTDRAKHTVNKAIEYAGESGHSEVQPAHLLYAMLQEGKGIAVDLLEELGANLDVLSENTEQSLSQDESGGGERPSFSDTFENILDYATDKADALQHGYVGTEHLVIALASDISTNTQEILREQGITEDDLASLLQDILEEYDEEASDLVQSGQETSKVGGGERAQTPSLDKFTRDLTEMARNNELDPVIGRGEEIERLIQIVGRRKKNNPVLIGEPGVGKTAIVEGLAQEVASMNVPEAMYNVRVLALDMALIVAGTKYRGEFEQRMKKVIDELKEADDVIVFIDELHSLVGAGAAEGAIDAANILKPALARGEIQCIGATTLDEYRKHIEKEAALERRFKAITVEEPSVEETVEILQGLKDRYEEHHDVEYADETLESAAQMAHRYLSEEFLPDSAIDLMDEVGSRVRLKYSEPPEDIQELQQELERVNRQKDEAVANQDFEEAAEYRDRAQELEDELEEKQEDWEDEQHENRENVVRQEDIAQLVSSITGVPVFKLTEDEQEKLLRMEDEIHKRLIGQDEAVNAVSRAIRRGRTGLKDPNRPVGTFMFLGPTGVGKTELAKSLAEFLFGDEEQLIRLDMSEYMEKHTVSRLIGAPPGYVGHEEGGQLTEEVRRNPYSVILLDEIEKAHHEVYNILLQIFEEGELSDHLDNTVDFRNTIIIMTSNVGSQEIKESGGIGFDTDEERALDYNEIKANVETQMKKKFEPEFINRLDETVVFQALTKDDLFEIVDLMLEDVRDRLREQQGVELEVTKEAKGLLIDEGYDPEYGARPLRRTIQRQVEDALAEKLLQDTMQDGLVIEVDRGDDGLVFDKRPAAEPAEAT